MNVSVTQKRIIAYLVDIFLCYIGVMIFIQWMFLAYFRERLGLDESWFYDGRHLYVYVLITISLPVWLYFILMDSERSSGTIGKKLFGLRVATEKGVRLSVGKSTVRTFFKLLPWELSHLTLIFPEPLYFDTEPEFRIFLLIAPCIILGNLLSIRYNRNKRVWYDVLLGTIVNSKTSLAKG